MTIIFGDASEYNGSFPDGPAMVARASIGAVRDAKFGQWEALAANRVRPFMAYAFINHDSLPLTSSSGGPGISAEQQADFAFSVIGPYVPCMLDWEPNRGVCATPDMAWRFINRYRSHGGVLHMNYLPKWTWADLGSPDLRPFSGAGIHLVSSNYPNAGYTETGPGWLPYGGVIPDQWQFTNNWQGSGVDGNAFRGTVDQWWTMVMGGGNNMAFADDPNAAAVMWRIDGGIHTGADTTQGGPTAGEQLWLPQQIKLIIANQAASAARETALAAAVQALTAGGTSVDTAALMAHIDQVAAAESAAVQGLQADLDQVVAANTALHAQVGDLQAKLAAAGRDLNS